MRLIEYANILARVIPYEFEYICADEYNIYLFRQKPVFLKNRWCSSAHNQPLMILQRDAFKLFPDLTEYAENGEIDYESCVEHVH